MKVLDLFSGCGGLSCGFADQGFEIIAGLDHWDDALLTFSRNHPNSDAIKADLAKSMDWRGLFSTEVDVIVGGPPCQGFSISGKRDPDDDRNSLYQAFVEAVRELAPLFFVMENVPNLQSMRKGAFAEAIRQDFEELGYDVHSRVLLASDFGVPQKRKRVFFIASKNSLNGLPTKTHGTMDETKLDNNLHKHENAINWIAKFDSDEYFEKEELTTGKKYYRELCQIPPGKNYFALTKRDNHPNPVFEPNKRFWSFLLKLHPNLPSWTIAAQPGPWVGPLHWNNRRLRVPEIAALQTFPDDYKFYGSRRSIQKQIGNAVPILMAKSVVRFLIDQL